MQQKHEKIALIDIDCPGEGFFRRIMAARSLKSLCANED